MELRQYFGDRFDKVIEAARREESPHKFSSCALDAEKLQLLAGNMTGKKQPMPEAARDYLNDLFETDISELRRLVNFDVSDWT